MDHITIKIRKSTHSRIKENMAEYIGAIKKPITMAEYLDRLSKVKLKSEIVKEQS